MLRVARTRSPFPASQLRLRLPDPLRYATLGSQGMNSRARICRNEGTKFSNVTMTKKAFLACLWGMVLFLAPMVLSAQDLVEDALADFPPQTLRIEYSSLARIRKIPGYQHLLKRYSDRHLQDLESSLAGLGLNQDDMDELAVGWGPKTEGREVYGLASGRFKPAVVIQGAAAKGSIEQIDGKAAVCSLGPEVACWIFLNGSRVAFGTRSGLKAMMEAPTGSVASLGSDLHYRKLMPESKADKTIWGVVIGAGVADWFQNWTANQKDMQTDWARTLQGADSLTYNVVSADKVYLTLVLGCATPETANHLQQLFESYKFMQQLAWQNRHHDQPNPLEGMEIGVNGLQTVLKITADLPVAGGV